MIGAALSIGSQSYLGSLRRMAENSRYLSTHYGEAGRLQVWQRRVRARLGLKHLLRLSNRAEGQGEGRAHGGQSHSPGEFAATSKIRRQGHDGKGESCKIFLLLFLL